MKLYRSLNTIFLIIFIIGTILCFKYLPSEIPLFMQSPSRWVFIGICFALLCDNGYNETVQNGSENMSLERKEQT